MIDLIQGILLALFQGIIEWLPISSEGQLSLFFVNIYGIQELEAVTLALLLHVGTMISVLWYFRYDFKQIMNSNSEINRIILLSTIGTAITAIPIVLIFKNLWESITINLPADALFTFLIGIFLIFTGIIISKQPEQGIRELNSLTNKEVILLGMAQGLAALPGISRSGMTISILLFVGLTQREALRTSFIISVPAVLGATTLEFFLNGFSFQKEAMIVGNVLFPYWLLIITILLTSMIGIITMDTLIRFENVPYDKFCLGFGILTILFAIIMFSVYFFI